MDRWIELSRLCRHLLTTVPIFEDAIAAMRNAASPQLRALLDEDTDWDALRTLTFEHDKVVALSWYVDDAASGIVAESEVLHLELGDVPQLFEISGCTWSDRIRLLDDGLVEPESIVRTLLPRRRHEVGELPSTVFSDLPYPPQCGDFAAHALWLLFCSFLPIEKLGVADLRRDWNVTREIPFLLGFEEAIFHGGFITPAGWKRPLRLP